MLEFQNSTYFLDYFCCTFFLGMLSKTYFYVFHVSTIICRNQLKVLKMFWIQNYEIYGVDFETEHIFKGHSSRSFKFLSLQIALLSIELSCIHPVSGEFCTGFGYFVLKTEGTNQNFSRILRLDIFTLNYFYFGVNRRFILVIFIDHFFVGVEHCRRTLRVCLNLTSTAFFFQVPQNLESCTFCLSFFSRKNTIFTLENHQTLVFHFSAFWLL